MLVLPAKARRQVPNNLRTAQSTNQLSLACSSFVAASSVKKPVNVSLMLLKPHGRSCAKSIHQAASNALSVSPTAKPSLLALGSDWVLMSGMHPLSSTYSKKAAQDGPRPRLCPNSLDRPELVIGKQIYSLYSIHGARAAGGDYEFPTKDAGL